MNDSEGIPDSEQIEPTGAEPLRRNSVSTKQIQDADLRTEWMNDSEWIPDSEQIEPTVVEPLRQNSVSAEQIQEADLRTEWVNDSEWIPDSEQIEPTRTAGSKTKHPYKGIFKSDIL